jgi:DNA-binding CsgD family transcriptional regulator
VVRKLALAPQQDRIVLLIMLSRSDKQIAAELGLALSTVRTYLDRVYGNAGVDDRLRLVHRIYAIAIDAWARERRPP